MIIRIFVIRISWFTDKFDLNEPTYPYFFRFLAVLFLGLRIRLSFMCRLIRTFFRFLMILILDIRIIYLCISFLIRTHHAKEILKSQIVRIKSCFKTNLIRTSLETHYPYLNQKSQLSSHRPVSDHYPHKRISFRNG